MQEQILSINEIESKSKKYNITVKDNDNYYANNILVHNCQILQEYLNKYKGLRCNVTEKLDGSSCTVYLNTCAMCGGDITIKDLVNGVLNTVPCERCTTGKEFGVCSRNLDLKINEKNIKDNAFVKTVTALKIEEKLRCLNKNVALQGELIGSGIQNNPLHLPDRQLRWFSAFNIDTGKYYSVYEFQELCKQLELDEVPLISMNYELDNNIDKLVEFASGVSALNTSCLREGIVIRPIENIIDNTNGVFQAGRVSFKVINPEYLLKHGE